jgi:hypothetical protein
MPRPDVRERVDPVRTLRADRTLPVTELPVVTLGALPADPPVPAGRDTGGDPQVEQ